MNPQGARRLTGVLLINTGSPASPTPEAVRSYLEQFLMDDRIRPLPAPVWRAILEHMILPRRCPASAEKYAAIWSDEGSPLVAGCRGLSSRIEKVLSSKRCEGRVRGPLSSYSPLVRAAMLYGEPSITSVLKELKREGCDRLVALPLYPQSAYSTTASALDALNRNLDRMGWRVPVVSIESYGDEPAYLDAVADSIQRAGYQAKSDHLLLSLHAIPLPDIDMGDTYTEQVRRSARAIAERIGAPDGSWSVSYQSPFEDGRRWTGPNTTRAVEKLAKCESRRLVVACPGFAVDCLETLYDIDRVLRAKYRALRPSADDLLYVPCLNDSRAHAELLAGIIQRAIFE